MNMDLKYKKHLLIIILLAFCLPFISVGQITKIMGKVSDADTKEPIPFVNISFKGTTIGTTTDFDGKYSLETKHAGDSLTASFVGYIPRSKKIQKNKFQTINIELKTANINLSEVVIKPGENPAEILLRKIIKNKENNDCEKLEAYQYETYNKIEIDMNNITEEFKKKRVFKHFQFIFDNVDTSTVNGISYLPVFITESLSDIYYRKSPKSKKEIIKATKVSGVENESISQFLGDLYQNVNIYDNYIKLFEKNFVSPVANFGLIFYKYYLIDSTFIDNQWCYNIMFKPKRKQELTFTGNFWVHDTTFAIKKFKIRAASDANINFINNMVCIQEFKRINNKYWMLSKDKLVIDFNITKNSKNIVGFFGKKTTYYKKFVFNQLKDDKFYSTPVNVNIETGSLNRSKKFWLKHRHDSLSKNERAIYKMVDSVKTIPAFKTYVDIIRIITTGYKLWGNIELGPYFTTYSFNEVEGNRFRIGGRTSNAFSKKAELNAHLAYGTKDEKIKYGGGYIYMLSKNPRRDFGSSYKYDIEQLGQSENAFREDNILASVLRRSPSDKLSMVKEFKVFYEHEWFPGFSNTIDMVYRDIYPVGSSKFKFLQGNTSEEKNTITTSEVWVNTRFAYKEKYIMGEITRTSLGSKYPIFELQYIYGIKNLWQSDYEYHKLQLNVRHWFNIGTIGWSKYIIQVGRICGKLPYPLLKLHEGNETYSFDEYAYNLMNYYEFISDKYLSVYYTHHFDGFFLNKIPLMRKLKWREVVFSKGVVGSLEDKNDPKNSNAPETLSALGKPYFEAGVGIENILKILRIDAVWRLSYLDKPDITKFGVMATLQLSF
jgi:hypothetical protein